MTANHPPCLSNVAPARSREKRQNGARGGDLTRGERGTVGEGGMKGPSRWSIPTFKQEPIMANRIPAVKERGREAEKISPSQAAWERNNRENVCELQLSAQHPSSAYTAFIIRSKNRILAYYITADRFKNTKASCLNGKENLLLSPLWLHLLYLQEYSSVLFFQAEKWILIFSLMHAYIWHKDNMKVYWSLWAN